MFIDKFEELISVPKEYTILFKEKRIVVIDTRHYDHYGYIADNNIVYQCKEPAEIEARNLLVILNNKLNMPLKLKEFIETRTQSLVRKSLSLYSDVDNFNNFCENIDFAHMYGIQKPVNTTLTVVATYNTEDAFDASFHDKKDEVFGFWDIEDNKISTSFLFRSPFQTKMCFSDFGKRHLSKGSLFLKMKAVRN